MSPIIKLMLGGIGLLGLAMANQGAGRVSDYINSLPLEGSLKSGTSLVSATAPEPLVALKTAQPTATAPTGDGDLERGFMREGQHIIRPLKVEQPTAETATPKAPAIDALVIGRIRLSGVTPAGAFINGVFVPVGQPLNMVLWEGADGRTPHIPVLKSTDEASAVIHVPQSKTTVTLRLPG